MTKSNKTKKANESKQIANEQLIEKKKKIKNSEEAILSKYKKDLPLYLENRLNEMTLEISKMEPAEGLNTIQINSLLRPKVVIGQPPKYTSEELTIVFEYYQLAMTEVNKKFKYPPSKENFCAFAGISTATYNQYLTGADEDKQEIMLMIDDYIRENMLTSAQLREVDNITTMFRGKTAHGLIEAQSPVIIEHRHETTSNEIQARLEALKRGESLKTIELKKNKEGIYEEE